MKRAILILVGLVFVLLLINELWNQKRTVEAKTDRSAKTNAVASRRFQKHLQTDIGTSQIISTNSSSTNEDEEYPWKQLSREQVDAYLLKAKRSPESLLNAFLETQDTNFLAEAALKYPDNPLVQWTMLWRASAEERPGLLAKLKTSSPDNALPNYLSALDNLKAGNTEQALAEMDAASKKNYSSFDEERRQSREEMYLLAGLSPLEAREQAFAGLLLPNLAEMKTLAQQISALQEKYRAAGDVASAEQLGALGVEASRKLADRKNPTLIDQLVGFAMENISLKNLDVGTRYEFLGSTPGDRMEEIKNQRQEVKDLMRHYDERLRGLTDAEKMIYLDRSRFYGELNALRWLNQNYGDETK